MAGMNQGSTDEEMIVGINVTPLVDVVLVLLIVFMITAPAIYQSAIKVELPKAISGEKTEHVTLKFTVTKDGKIIMGKDQIAMSQVTGIVKQGLEKDSTANAVIFADAGASHGSVMGLLDAIKSSGVTRFALGVDTPQKTGSK